MSTIYVLLRCKVHVSIILGYYIWVLAGLAIFCYE